MASFKDARIMLLDAFNDNSIKDARIMLFDAFNDNSIDEDEFVLLYNLNTSKTLCFRTKSTRGLSWQT